MFEKKRQFLLDQVSLILSAIYLIWASFKFLNRIWTAFDMKESLRQSLESIFKPSQTG